MWRRIVSVVWWGEKEEGFRSVVQLLFQRRRQVQEQVQVSCWSKVPVGFRKNLMESLLPPDRGLAAWRVEGRLCNSPPTDEGRRTLWCYLLLWLLCNTNHDSGYNYSHCFACNLSTYVKVKIILTFLSTNDTMHFLSSKWRFFGVPN